MKKLLVVLLILGLAAPAMAADWHWYGSARVYFGYVSNSEELAAWPGGVAINPIPGNDGTITPTATQSGGLDDSGTTLSWGSMRVGARAVASDSITGQVEIGYWFLDTASRLGASSPTAGDGELYTGKFPMWRLLYGQWKYGGGNIRVGQDYSPATFLLYSNSIGDGGLLGGENGLTVGLPYISRNPMLKLTHGGFQVALIEQNTNNQYEAIKGISTPAALGADYRDIDIVIPRIELAYQFNTPVVSLRPILGYQTYELNSRTTTAGIVSETSQTITSYLAGLGVNLRFGPAYVNLAGSYSQNPGNYGLWQYNSAATRFAGYKSLTDVNDATGITGMLVAGVKINPTIKIEAGYGLNMTESEQTVVPTINAKLENTVSQWYIQAPITVASGFVITPELGQFDYGDVDTTVLGTKTTSKRGNSTYFIARFQINF